MAKFNSKLNERLSKTSVKPALKASQSIKKPNTVNTQGFQAYKVDKWLQLLSMLNTLKVEEQFYKSVGEQFKHLQEILHACAKEDALLAAKCIVYSRCVGEGMRSINHVAGVLILPYISGKPWAKDFFSLWNKKENYGGCIFRPDDMSEMTAIYSILNQKNEGFTLPNSMKKGFKQALENMDAHRLLKYKKVLIDIINLVHPREKMSKAWKDKETSIFNAIINNLPISADTHEVVQSEAGQMVAKAVKEGKLSDSEAAEVLKEAKQANWAQLIGEKKLGILAAIRNLNNILKTDPSPQLVMDLCNTVLTPQFVRQGKIMPYQLDLAQEMVKMEFSNAQSRTIVQRLLAIYEEALPNFAEMLQGNNLVLLDMSGSMHFENNSPRFNGRYLSTTSAKKAALIAATICKATNADIIRFGGTAEGLAYNPNQDVFSLGEGFMKTMGSTNLANAWDLARRSKRHYNRVFVLSDNECNRGNIYSAYKQYMQECGDPYVYSIDLASYGTQSMAGPKVNFYYGFGYAMFDDIASKEFNPSLHLDKVKAIRFTAE